MEHKVQKYLIWATAIVAVLIILVMLFGGGEAKAQQATAGSNSSSDSNATVNMGGQTVYLDQRGASKSRTEVVNSGKYTVRSAPAVQAPSMGSGHPCALSGSVGISIIGGGVSGGAMKIDEACLLAQMGQGEAALIMIARRDKEACNALRAVGRIPQASQCGTGDGAAVTRPSSKPAIPTCPQGATWDGKGCWMPAKAKR